ncbi:MAG: MATE family efflux transporter [Treponema sp.]|nr:MATE family efflux transporter [Treponema sp.]MCL2251899.1 MATE family efflux transporter [Treponema sp.]
MEKNKTNGMDKSGIITSNEPVIHSSPIDTPVTLTPVDWNNKRLFTLFWPLIVEQLFVVMIGIVDMVMVSSVGEHAVSGISLVETINFLIITAFNAIATGGSVVASQYLGRNEEKNASCSARQLIYIGLVISVVLMILTLFTRRLMLRAIFGNIADDVLASADVYFIFIALSYPFLALYTAAAAMFRSMGNSKVPMRAVILLNIFNIAGNAFLIYVLKLGVAGAAISTFIGRVIVAVILIKLLTKDKTRLINLCGITKIKLEGAMIKRILNIGIPSGLESSMFQVGKILITRIFTMFGTAAIAANAVGATINSIAFMPGSGFGMGLLIVAGHCIGAGDYLAVKKYTKKIMILSYLTYFIININIFIFMDPIISVFNLSAEAHEMCRTFLKIHCITSTLFWCPSFVLPNALKAAGDARYVMVVAACTMWLIRVCSAFFMAYTLGLGPVAVYLAMGADFLFRGIFFIKRWRSNKWIEKKVIQ